MGGQFRLMKEGRGGYEDGKEMRKQEKTRSACLKMM